MMVCRGCWYTVSLYDSESLATEPEYSVNDIGNMYLNEVKEDDKRITDARKDDANGILVFVSPYLLVSLFVSMTSKKTGLFSATVGIFIIEFYKKLSPDSGAQTVALLGQMSQQLANFPNGNYSSVAIQPSPPSASMIWVNAMWLISLVLSLTSAFIATLLQQWARRYIETINTPSEPNRRARIRSFLFLGTEFYHMRVLVEIVPTFLHLSLFLFFAGLVVVFHTVNTKVAIAVDVSVGLFVLAYIMLSIIPCLDMRCPYRTPVSYILWYSYRAFPSLTKRCLYWLVDQLRGRFVRHSLIRILLSSWRQRLLLWLYSHRKFVQAHWHFEERVFDVANVQEGDYKIVTSLFNILAQSDKSKLRKLAAGIPRHKVPELIRPVEFGEIVLRDPLLVLLRSCEAGAPDAGLDEDARKHALLVCLDAIHAVAKTPSIPELNFVQANFANTGHMERLCDHSDPSIRVTSSSICALVARQVIREPGALLQLAGEPQQGPQLRWLIEALGEALDAILNPYVARLDHINLRSFVYRVLSNQVGDLPTEDVTSFKETLAILLDVRTDDRIDTNIQSRLPAEVQRMREGPSAITDDVVDKLCSIFPYLREAPTDSVASNPVASTQVAATQAASVPTSTTHSAPIPTSSTHAAPIPASSHPASTHSASTPASSIRAASLHHDPLAQV
jgi:uncharacterized protein DUF6535